MPSSGRSARSRPQAADPGVGSSAHPASPRPPLIAPSPFTQRVLWGRRAVRAVLTAATVAAVAVGMAVSPPMTLPAAAQTTAPAAPGAAGYTPPAPPAIYVPGSTINVTPTGGASTGPWSNNSSVPPAGQAVQASTPAAKPGLGVQNYYPVERRQLGDRLELDIDTANGNVVVHQRDLTYAGTGLNTSVDHVFNDQATNTGSFGRGWTMTTGRDVGLDLSNPNSIVLQGPTGYQQTYASDGNGGYTSPPAADAKLTKNSGGYQLQFNKTKEKWNFDNNGFFTAQVDRHNNTITFNYNPTGTLASIKDTRGAVTGFNYDANGRVTSMTDPTGQNYGPYTYDALTGNETGFTDASGNKVSFQYNKAGDITQITDPDGNQYNLGYDSSKRITSLSEPNGPTPAVTTFAYPSAGQTTETDPNGGTTSYFFDSDGKQTKATDPLGRSQSKTYTANFNTATTTSVGGNSTTASFDPNNNLVGTQLPTGAKDVAGYTDAANPNAPTSMTDSQGRQTTMTYDSAGDPLTVKNAQTGQGLTRTYNPNGTVKDSTDGNGNKTSYTYDSVGRLVTVTPSAPRKPVTYTYDSRSRITSVTDGNGVRINYAYDHLDRVVQLSQQTGTTSTPVEQTDFDANGNKIANYFSTVTTQFTYNQRNQVLSATRHTGPLGAVVADVVSYGYDPADNVTSLQDAGGTTKYAYDKANDVTTLTDIVGKNTTFSYDSDGNRSNTAYPNGASEARTYDKSKRVTKITNNSAGAAASVRTYSYTGTNATGGTGDTQLVQTVGEPNNTTTRYTYDGGARETDAKNTNNSTGAVATDYPQGYDKAGNMTNFEGNTFTYNTANELSAAPASSAIYSDPQGNGIGDNAGTSINYTSTNQQKTKTSPDISFTSTYDTADNTQLNHITDKVAATGATYNYDVTNTALGVTGRVRVGQGRYSISRDPDGTPVMQRNPDGSTHYFELDRQGSVMGTTNSGGTRTAAFHYRPYGQPDVTSGADSSNADNFLGFQGGFFHSTFRNTHFNARWYSGGVGRFDQPDPIGTPGSSGNGQDDRSGIGGPYSTEGNAYAFAAGDPCNKSDPSGFNSVYADHLCGFTSFVSGGVGIAGGIFRYQSVFGNVDDETRAGFATLGAASSALSFALGLQATLCYQTDGVL